MKKNNYKDELNSIRDEKFKTFLDKYFTKDEIEDLVKDGKLKDLENKYKKKILNIQSSKRGKLGEWLAWTYLNKKGLNGEKVELDKITMKLLME